MYSIDVIQRGKKWHAFIWRNTGHGSQLEANFADRNEEGAREKAVHHLQRLADRASETA